MIAPKPGADLWLVRDAGHADAKTRNFEGALYPVIPKGTRVLFIREWVNGWGRWWRIRAPGGLDYDLSPQTLTDHNPKGDL